MTVYIFPPIALIAAGQMVFSGLAARSFDAYRALQDSETVAKAFASIALSAELLLLGFYSWDSLGLMTFATQGVTHAAWGVAGALFLIALGAHFIDEVLQVVHAYRYKEVNRLLESVFQGALVTPTPMQGSFETNFVAQGVCSLGLAAFGVSPVVCLALAALQMQAANFISERRFACFHYKPENQGRYVDGLTGNYVSNIEVLYYAEVRVPKRSSANPKEKENSNRELSRQVPDIISPVQLRSQVKGAFGWSCEVRSQENIHEFTGKIQGVLKNVFQSVQKNISFNITINLKNGLYDGEDVVINAKVPKAYLLGDDATSRYLQEVEMSARCTFDHEYIHRPKTVECPVYIDWT